MRRYPVPNLGAIGQTKKGYRGGGVEKVSTPQNDSPKLTFTLSEIGRAENIIFKRRVVRHGGSRAWISEWEPK